MAGEAWGRSTARRHSRHADFQQPDTLQTHAYWTSRRIFKGIVLGDTKMTLYRP